MSATKSTEVFDPSRSDGDDSVITLESRFSMLEIPTIPVEDRRRVATEVLASVCSRETIESLLSLTGAIATNEEQIARARISIGGHFWSIHTAIHQGLLEKGSQTDRTVDNAALALTYRYIEAIHGYSRAVARNHMLVWQQFNNNADAMRVLKHTEMVLVAQVRDEDAREQLIHQIADYKESSDNETIPRPVLIQMIKETKAQLDQANDEIATLKGEVAEAQGDVYVRNNEFQRLSERQRETERALEEARQTTQKLAQARSEAVESLVAERQDASQQQDLLKALRQELQTAKNTPRVETKEVEVLPPQYKTLQEAVAAAESALLAKQEQINLLEAEESRLRQQVEEAQRLFTEEARAAEIKTDVDEVQRLFGTFHSAYIAARLKIANAGKLPLYRDMLIELETKLEACAVEVKAAIARGA